VNALAVVILGSLDCGAHTRNDMVAVDDFALANPARLRFADRGHRNNPIATQFTHQHAHGACPDLHNCR